MMAGQIIRAGKSVEWSESMTEADYIATVRDAERRAEEKYLNDDGTGGE